MKSKWYLIMQPCVSMCVFWFFWFVCPRWRHPTASHRLVGLKTWVVSVFFNLSESKGCWFRTFFLGGPGPGPVNFSKGCRCQSEDGGGREADCNSSATGKIKPIASSMSREVKLPAASSHSKTSLQKQFVWLTWFRFHWMSLDLVYF